MPPPIFRFPSPEPEPKSESVSREPPRTLRTLLRRGRSGIHGAGVYARVVISAGERIVEYTGERITKAEGRRREAIRLERLRRGLPASTFLFDLNKRHDLDGSRGGNISRFINHSCEPNCQSEQVRGRIWIVALRDIAPDEELTMDYGFPIADWSDNPCRCGKPACIGFIVAKGQRWRIRRKLEAIAGGQAAAR